MTVTNQNCIHKNIKYKLNVAILAAIQLRPSCLVVSYQKRNTNVYNTAILRYVLSGWET
jgi:hypothetical protein